ncbi:MAG: SurA N-terminal domain-containing protein, partial [Ardenticatenales bacterium]|nr:SurA N-terminal domain-containing protein [Ardenticatenales bacterium]
MADNPQKDKALNRKHVSRAEREALVRQRVTIGTAAVVALIVVILGAGAIYSAFVEPGQPMAQVYGETITRREFYQRVNYERFRVFQLIKDTKEQYIELSADPETAGFLGQFYDQQLQQLAQIYSGVGAQTLEQMIEEKIIERKAAERNITVTDEEVDEEIRRQIARQEDAQIAADVTATAEAAIAATATAELFTPTPSPTVEATATTERTPTVRGTATARGTATRATATVEVESETGVISPTLTPMPTLTPAPTLTPNIFTEDRFTPAYQAYLSDLQSRVGYTE